MYLDCTHVPTVCVAIEIRFYFLLTHRKEVALILYVFDLVPIMIQIFQVFSRYRNHLFPFVV